MTTIVDDAIEVLRELPEEKQATVARAILSYSAEDSIYHLNDEERREVREGLAEVARGDIATDAEVAETYRRIGL